MTVFGKSRAAPQPPSRNPERPFRAAHPASPRTELKPRALLLVFLIAWLPSSSAVAEAQEPALGAPEASLASAGSIYDFLYRLAPELRGVSLPDPANPLAHFLPWRHIDPDRPHNTEEVQGNRNYSAEDVLIEEDWVIRSGATVTFNGSRVLFKGDHFIRVDRGARIVAEPGTVFETDYDDRDRPGALHVFGDLEAVGTSQDRIRFRNVAVAALRDRGEDAGTVTIRHAIFDGGHLGLAVSHSDVTVERSMFAGLGTGIFVRASPEGDALTDPQFSDNLFVGNYIGYSVEGGADMVPDYGPTTGGIGLVQRSNFTANVFGVMCVSAGHEERKPRIVESNLDMNVAEGYTGVRGVHIPVPGGDDVDVANSRCKIESPYFGDSSRYLGPDDQIDPPEVNAPHALDLAPTLEDVEAEIGFHVTFVEEDDEYTGGLRELDGPVVVARGSELVVNQSAIIEGRGLAFLGAMPDDDAEGATGGRIRFEDATLRNAMGVLRNEEDDAINLTVTGRPLAKEALVQWRNDQTLEEFKARDLDGVAWFASGALLVDPNEPVWTAHAPGCSATNVTSFALHLAIKDGRISDCEFEDVGLVVAALLGDLEVVDSSAKRFIAGIVTALLTPLKVNGSRLEGGVIGIATAITVEAGANALDPVVIEDVVVAATRSGYSAALEVVAPQVKRSTFSFNGFGLTSAASTIKVTNTNVVHSYILGYYTQDVNGVLGKIDCGTAPRECHSPDDEAWDATFVGLPPDQDIDQDLPEPSWREEGREELEAVDGEVLELDGGELDVPVIARKGGHVVIENVRVDGRSFYPIGTKTSGGDFDNGKLTIRNSTIVDARFIAVDDPAAVIEGNELIGEFGIISRGDPPRIECNAFRDSLAPVTFWDGASELEFRRNLVTHSAPPQFGPTLDVAQNGRAVYLGMSDQSEQDATLSDNRVGKTVGLLARYGKGHVTATHNNLHSGAYVAERGNPVTNALDQELNWPIDFTDNWWGNDTGPTVAAWDDSLNPDGEGARLFYKVVEDDPDTPGIDESLDSAPTPVIGDEFPAEEHALAPCVGFRYGSARDTPTRSIQFTDLSFSLAEDDIEAWDWDFGDNRRNESRNPIHTYDTVGDYTVRLNVTWHGQTYGPAVREIHVEQTATQITLEASEDDLESGSDRELVATIQDAAGNTVLDGPESTLQVTFEKVGGTGTVTGLGTVQAQDGVASRIVTGAQAGPIQLEASTSSPSLSSALLEFAVVAGDATSFDIDCGAASQPVASTATCTASDFRDAEGNPAAAQVVTFSARDVHDAELDIDGDGSFVLPEHVDDGPVTINGTGDLGATGSPASIALSPAATAQVAWVSHPNSTDADTPVTFEAEARDAYGNPTGQSITYSIVSEPARGTIDATSGVYTPDQVGNDTIRACAGNVCTGTEPSELDQSIEVSAGALASFDVTCDPNPASAEELVDCDAADGRDAHDNPQQIGVVAWSAEDAAGDGVQISDDGVFTTPTLASRSPVVVTATAEGVAETESVSFEALASNFTIDCGDTNQTVASTATCTASDFRDAEGNPAAAQVVTFSARDVHDAELDIDGDGSFVLPENVDDGPVTVTGTGDAGASGGPVSIALAPAAANRVVWVSHPDNTDADTSVTFQAEAYDAYENPTGQALSYSITNQPPRGSIASATGVYTPDQVGNDTIRACAGNVCTGTEPSELDQSIEVSAGALASFDVTCDPDPAPVNSEVACSVSDGRDAHENPQTIGAVAWSAEDVDGDPIDISADGTFTTPTQTDQGPVTVTGVAQDVSQTEAVALEPSAITSIAITNGDIVQDVDDTSDVNYTVTATDEFGNEVPINSAEEVSWSIDDEAGGSFAANVLTPGTTEGVYTVTATLNAQENITDGASFTLEADVACTDEARVRLYRNINYNGGCKAFNRDDPDFANDEFDNGNGLNDAASSAKVKIGYKAILYEHPNYGGTAYEAAGDVNPLPNSIDDKASSLRVVPIDHTPCSDTSIVRVYRNINYNGGCNAFAGDHADFTNAQFDSGPLANDAISSIKVKIGYKAILYEHPNFEGASYEATGDVNPLPNSMDDKASSLRVVAINHVPCTEESIVRVYRNINYNGGCDALAADDANFVDDQFDSGPLINEEISSIRVKSGYKAILYEHADYGGVSYAATGDINPLPNSIDDKASSLRIQAFPHAAFSYAPPTPSPGDLVAFTDESTDADGDLESWEWNFGDGTPISHERHPTHAYAATGRYTVRLTVTDSEGNSHNTPQTITVGPLADFSWAPLQPHPGEEVAFTDQSTSGSAPLVSWAWDFDDTHTSTDQHPRHTYAQCGDYHVTLTVTDADGRTSDATKTVQVRNEAVNGVRTCILNAI